jgi:hypothetical protein
MTEPDRSDVRADRGEDAPRSLVRPYTLTRGRTASGLVLPPETVVTAREQVPEPLVPPAGPRVSRAELRDLGEHVRGPLWLPDDDGFAAEIASSYATVVHRPLAVLGVRDRDDVAAAVRFAAERTLPVAVQATGHGAVAPVDGGLLLSTRRMRELVVDPGSRTVRVGAGVVWTEVIAAAARFGLAPLSGSAPGVGVTGYTLGGGLSPLARTYGYTADHVRAVEIVTADGRVRRIDADHDPELFWAVRGGKGNFGIVTTLVLDLLAPSRFYGGGLFYRGEAAAEVLHAYRDWSPRLPEATTTSVLVSRVPDRSGRLGDGPGVHVRVAHVGDAREGARLVAPLRELGPEVDTLSELPFTAVGTIHDDPTEPVPAWKGGTLLSALGPDTVDTVLRACGPGVADPVLSVELRHLGGALARPPAVPNAVGGRNAAYSVFALDVPGPGGSPSPRGERLLADLAPYSTGGVALNFLGTVTDADRVATAWDPATYRRLVEVKRRWDPENLFRFGYALAPPGPARRELPAAPTPKARTPEAGAIVELCRPWSSVAEISARLHLPLGVVRILLEDLRDDGLVHIHQLSPDTGEDTDHLERALRELRKRL